MNASCGNVISNSSVQTWQMGNICVGRKIVPGFRVEPQSTNHGYESEDRVAYCLPWEENQRAVAKAHGPCCFCWCCFCSCPTKHSSLNRTTPSTTTARMVEDRSNSSIIGLEIELEGDERLTSDKLRRWMFDFESLLSDEAGKKIFEAFLKQEYSDENLKFWIEVEKMKAVQDGDTRYYQIKKIYRDYIQPRSLNEVNVEAWIRKGIEETLEQPSSEIFDPAQTQVYLLMYRQSWPRFLASKYYQNLLVNLSVTSL